MSRRFTFALQTCLNCQHTFGVGLWPWSGEVWKRTHGLCKPCRAELAASFDDERPADRAEEAWPPAA